MRLTVLALSICAALAPHGARAQAPDRHAEAVALARDGRHDLAQACFTFLPTRAALDLAGWGEEDIFAHS
jgi:ribonuclease D